MEIKPGTDLKPNYPIGIRTELKRSQIPNRHPGLVFYIAKTVGYMIIDMDRWA